MMVGFLTKYSSIGYYIFLIDYPILVIQLVNASRILTLLAMVILAVVLNQANPGFEVYNEKVSLVVK